VRPDVVEVQAQSVGHALSDRRLQRVVVGDGVVRAAADALKDRIRAKCRIVRRPLALGYLVEVGREVQVRSVAGDVRNLGHKISAQGALH
jgi:predicted RNA-binding protein with PIN domain